MEQAAELQELVSSRDVPADVATWGRIVLRSTEGSRRKDIASSLGVLPPTETAGSVDMPSIGLAGLEGTGPAEPGMSADTSTDPGNCADAYYAPDATGLSHWFHTRVGEVHEAG